jgi:hypothetical protein
VYGCPYFASPDGPTAGGDRACDPASMDETVRTLLIRVGELQLERQRLHDAGAGRFELERNRIKLVRAQHALVVALGAEHAPVAA